MRKFMVVFVAVIFLIGATSFVAESKGGNPFDVIWGAIEYLQEQIDNIQLLSGPQGPQGLQGEPGPQGEQGESNWDEQRVQELEILVLELEARTEALENQGSSLQPSPPPPPSLPDPDNDSVYLEKDFSQHLYIPHEEQIGLDITGDLTIELWVKPKTSPDGGSGWSEDMNLVEKWNYRTLNRCIYFAYFGGNHRLRFSVSKDGLNDSEHSSYDDYYINLPLTSWTHIAVTYNAIQGTGNWYINGVWVQGFSGWVNSIHDGISPIEIGRLFDGFMDEVRIWNVERTEIEISSFMDVEMSGSEPGLMGYWKMNNDFFDSSFNGNDLTPYGSLVFSSDTPF